MSCVDCVVGTKYNKVPKGPQLKIQRALRAAGIGSAESKSSHVSAAVATPNVATEEKEEEKMPYSEDRCCVICLERKIEVGDCSV